MQYACFVANLNAPEKLFDNLKDTASSLFFLRKQKRNLNRNFDGSPYLSIHSAQI